MATSPSVLLVRNNSSDVSPSPAENVDTQRLKRRAISEDSNLRVKKIVTDQQFKSDQLDLDRMTAVASRSEVISPAGTVETPLELIDLTSSSDEGEILSPPSVGKSAVVMGGRDPNCATNSAKIDGDLLNPTLMSHEEIVRSSVSPDDSIDWPHVQPGLQPSSSRPDLHQPIQMVQVGRNGALEGPSRIYDPIASPSSLMGHSHSNCHGHLHVTVTPTPIICACANNLGRCGCTTGVSFCGQLQLCPYCTSGQSISPNHRCIHGYSVETQMPPATLFPTQFWNAAGPSVTSAAEILCPQSTAPPNYAESLAGLYNLAQTSAGRPVGSPSVTRADSRGRQDPAETMAPSSQLDQLQMRLGAVGRNTSRSPLVHLGTESNCNRQENLVANNETATNNGAGVNPPTSASAIHPANPGAHGNPPFHRRPASSIPLGHQRLLQQQQETLSRQRDAQTRWFERHHLQAVASHQQPSLFHHVFNPTVNPTAFNPVSNSLTNPLLTSLARAAAAATIPSLATQVNLTMGNPLGLDLHGSPAVQAGFDPNLLVNPNDNGSVPVTTPQYAFQQYLPAPVHQRSTLVDPLGSAYAHAASGSLLHPSLNPMVNSRHCQFPSLIPLQMPHLQNPGRQAASYQPPTAPYQHVNNSTPPALHRHHHHYTGSPVFAPRQPELTHNATMAPVPTLGDLFRFGNVQVRFKFNFRTTFLDNYSSLLLVS